MVKRNISYGEHSEQTLDIYFSNKKEKTSRFTIVFIHGGAYFYGNKEDMDSENFIQQFLKKNYNLININYRLKQGIQVSNTDVTLALNFLKRNNFDLNLKRTNTLWFFCRRSNIKHHWNVSKQFFISSQTKRRLKNSWNYKFFWTIRRFLST